MRAEITALRCAWGIQWLTPPVFVCWSTKVTETLTEALAEALSARGFADFASGGAASKVSAAREEALVGAAMQVADALKRFSAEDVPPLPTQAGAVGAIESAVAACRDAGRTLRVQGASAAQDSSGAVLRALRRVARHVPAAIGAARRAPKGGNAKKKGVDDKKEQKVVPGAPRPPPDKAGARAAPRGAAAVKAKARAVGAMQSTAAARTKPAAGRAGAEPKLKQRPATQRLEVCRQLAALRAAAEQALGGRGDLDEATAEALGGALDKAVCACDAIEDAVAAVEAKGGVKSSARGVGRGGAALEAALDNLPRAIDGDTTLSEVVARKFADEMALMATDTHLTVDVQAAVNACAGVTPRAVGAAIAKAASGGADIVALARVLMALEPPFWAAALATDAPLARLLPAGLLGKALAATTSEIAAAAVVAVAPQMASSAIAGMPAEPAGDAARAAAARVASLAAPFARLSGKAFVGAMAELDLGLADAIARHLAREDPPALWEALRPVAADAGVMTALATAMRPATAGRVAMALTDPDGFVGGAAPKGAEVEAAAAALSGAHAAEAQRIRAMGATEAAAVLAEASPLFVATLVGLVLDRSELKEDRDEDMLFVLEALAAAPRRVACSAAAWEPATFAAVAAAAELPLARALVSALTPSGAAELMQALPSARCARVLSLGAETAAISAASDPLVLKVSVETGRDEDDVVPCRRRPQTVPAAEEGGVALAAPAEEAAGEPAAEPAALVETAEVPAPAGEPAAVKEEAAAEPTAESAAEPSAEPAAEGVAAEAPGAAEESVKAQEDEVAEPTAKEVAEEAEVVPEEVQAEAAETAAEPDAPAAMVGDSDTLETPRAAEVEEEASAATPAPPETPAAEEVAEEDGVASAPPTPAAAAEESGAPDQ